MDAAFFERTEGLNKTQEDLDRIFDGEVAVTEKKKGATGTFLYFDLETVPDWESAKEIGIKRIEVPSPTAVNDLPELDNSGTEAEIRKRYALVREPPDDWTQRLRVMEENNPKPRKGVLGFIDELGSDCKERKDLEEQIKQLSVCAETCMIASMAAAVDGHEVECRASPGDLIEADLLHWFWDLACRCRHVVGFNHIDFDIPVIKIRSIKLGVPAKRSFSDKPWESDLIDIYKRRFNGRRPSGFGKLKDLVGLMGIDVPAGEGSGGDVNRWYEAGETEKIKFYNASDVEVTRSLHRKYMGYFC